MSTFRYRAAASNGAIEQGVIAGVTADTASGELRERGLTIVSIVPCDTVRAGRRAPRRQLAMLFRNLESLTTAGVPLERALASSADLFDGRLGRTLQAAQGQLRAGKPLSLALNDGSGTVPAVALGMIRGGERAGRMPESLGHIANHFEREADLLGSAGQALAYPAVLLVVGAAALMVLLTRVVPQFARLLLDAGAPLPAGTRVLVGAARLLDGHAGLLIGAAAALVVIAGLLIRTGPVRDAVMVLVHRTPMVGDLVTSLAAARICMVLASVLDSGAGVLAALEASGEAAAGPVAARRLRLAAERVKEGESLTGALQAAGALTGASVQLLRIGEQSGRLPEMARRAAELSAQTLKRRLEVAVALVEPAMILGFGAVVAFVAAALLQAVYGLRPGLAY